MAPADGSNHPTLPFQAEAEAVVAATRPAQDLAAQFAARGLVLGEDGYWRDPAKPHLPPFRSGGVSPFSAEDWADYDAGRPERCQPDLMAREARRIARDRDGF